MQVGAANLERARYVQRKGRENLQMEEEKRTGEMRMGLELEMKTIEREIAQLKRKGEDARSQNRSLCTMM